MIAADPSAPLDFPKQLAAAATIAAAAPEARAFAFDHKKHSIKRNFRLKLGWAEIPCEKEPWQPWRSDDKWNIWSAWNQDLIQSLFNNEGSATKDVDFSVTDRECKQYPVHNGTFPALAHPSTRGYALTLFLVWLKPSRFIFAP